MTTTAVPISHIVLDEHGRPWIAGTRTKVIEVAIDKIAYGWGPEQMQRQHPHLSLAQLHAALSYYYDHQTEIDAEIQRGAADADRARSEAVHNGRQFTRAQLDQRSSNQGHRA